MDEEKEALHPQVDHKRIVESFRHVAEKIQCEERRRRLIKSFVLITLIVIIMRLFF